jgi:hypothetical protein
MIDDTNGGIIRHRSKKDRKYNDKKIEDTNVGILYHFAIAFSVLL